ncbi:MAG: UDP-N-acetylglucosamine--N-acetylmuramyl-(pentapeptide) pyrophosphoryl-undecaprenol N-acetylglucosamine transferase [Planctomycetota bacterium]|nr:MAG: UDP-N-acetylglucosamine--N-acetylmuramyl-(pentapeptide) pyrophosphoryl-undecaprenol N-acetylglucosamine transferase [Planctomycetota bacterium]
MIEKPWFVFAGGGTAGHLFPALGVAESLRLQPEQIDISFFCTNKPSDKTILDRTDVEIIPQSVRPFSAKPWRWPVFWACWRESLSSCRRAFQKRRPAVVVGTGGYASGPPVRAAIQLGIPTFLLNPDAVPGRANRYLARQGKLAGIFAQWPVTLKHFPRGTPVLVTGCPVRRSFRYVDRAEVPSIVESFNLDPERKTLLVTGASQGAKTINETMIELAGLIAAQGWQVLHLSGLGDRDRVTQAYAKAGTRGVVLPFTDRMSSAMAAAELIVSRAGASSLAELLAMAKPAILFPYPFHRDRHQWHNGQVLVEAGAAMMLEDLKEAKANADRLRPILVELMEDDRQRAKMGQLAGALSRPQAADDVADTLWQASKGG